MPSNKLPKSATISVIIGRLRDPEAYLRGVLNNMMLCKRQHGSAVVRIGTTGEGLIPHYRVEPSATELEALTPELLASTHEEVEQHSTHRLATYYNAYRGTSHEKLDWGHRELQAESWSSQSMSLDEVRDLLGKVRDYKPKGK
jgi:hypothetical protein